MGAATAGGPSATVTRHLDATSALNVQRLLADAASADGFVGLSDQLAADLEDLGGGAAEDSIVATVDDAHGAFAGMAIASRRDGDWTMQAVTAAADRDGRTASRLVGSLLDAVGVAGGGRVDWWVYSPSAADDAVAADAGLRADRDLLQMRRALPAERRSEVVTRSFRPGADDAGWLEVNNRAFAGHHEQHGWTTDTLHQRMRQPWFDPDDLRLYERDGRLAAFCWTKRHESWLYEIYVIGVDPDFQGLGLGAQLTLAGLDHMVSRGATEALLYVAAENATAVAMYTRLGFTVRRTDRAYVGEVRSADR